MNDKEFAEKFGKIISHYVRGMISRDEVVMELSGILISENPESLSHYVIANSVEIIESLMKEEV